MVKKEYIINGKSYKSKSEITKYFKNIKDKYHGGTLLKEKNMNEYNDVLSLFNEHSKSSEKLKGITNIVIKKNPSGSNAFYIVKGDIHEDISYLHIINKCLGNDVNTINKKVQLDNLKSAMRYSFYSQKLEFRNNCNDKFCVFCKTTENLEIDHVIEFNIVMKNFLKKTNLETPIEFDDHHTTHAAIFKKKDIKFEKEWFNYHKENTSLRYLCKKCNCSRNRKEKI